MSAWMYFVILIAFVAFGFAVSRRPMYEVLLASVVFMVLITGNFSNIGVYLVKGANSYLLYTIAAFIAFALVLEKTGVISDMINVIVAIVGKVSGGAGYVALVASAAMGALSGSGPANSAAVGVITIPSMKRTGYPPELAATVEMAASSLGPIIPPSAAIVILFGALDSVFPNQYTFSQFWLFAWVIAFWFLLQRFITLFFLIRKYKVQPIPKEERLPLGLALKQGWRALLLPVIVFIPFIIDALMKDTFVTSRLGEAGATSFASILLTVVPSISIAYASLLAHRKKNPLNFTVLVNYLREGISAIAPIIIMAFAGFALTELFNDIGVAESISAAIHGVTIPRWVAAIICPLIFTVLGMFMEVTSLFVLLGPIYITLAAAAGINPMLAAMMVNVMTCAMGHMTPPFALCFYVCMGIAESEFRETAKLSVIWCIGQFILTVLILYGVIPMFGIV